MQNALKIRTRCKVWIPG